MAQPMLSDKELNSTVPSLYKTGKEKLGKSFNAFMAPTLSSRARHARKVSLETEGRRKISFPSLGVSNKANTWMASAVAVVGIRRTKYSKLGNLSDPDDHIRCSREASAIQISPCVSSNIGVPAISARPLSRNLTGSSPRIAMLKPGQPIVASPRQKCLPCPPDKPLPEIPGPPSEHTLQPRTRLHSQEQPFRYCLDRTQDMRHDWRPRTPENHTSTERTHGSDDTSAASSFGLNNRLPLYRNSSDMASVAYENRPLKPWRSSQNASAENLSSYNTAASNPQPKKWIGAALTDVKSQEQLKPLVVPRDERDSRRFAVGSCKAGSKLPRRKIYHAVDLMNDACGEICYRSLEQSSERTLSNKALHSSNRKHPRPTRTSLLRGNFHSAAIKDLVPPSKASKTPVRVGTYQETFMLKHCKTVNHRRDEAAGEPINPVQTPKADTSVKLSNLSIGKNNETNNDKPIDDACANNALSVYPLADTVESLPLRERTMSEKRRQQIRTKTTSNSGLLYESRSEGCDTNERNMMNLGQIEAGKDSDNYREGGRGKLSYWAEHATQGSFNAAESCSVASLPGTHKQPMLHYYNSTPAQWLSASRTWSAIKDRTAHHVASSPNELVDMVSSCQESASCTHNPGHTADHRRRTWRPFRIANQIMARSASEPDNSICKALDDPGQGNSPNYSTRRFSVHSIGPTLKIYRSAEKLIMGTQSDKDGPGQVIQNNRTAMSPCTNSFGILEITARPEEVVEAGPASIISAKSSALTQALRSDKCMASISDSSRKGSSEMPSFFRPEINFEDPFLDLNKAVIPKTGFVQRSALKADIGVKLLSQELSNTDQDAESAETSPKSEDLGTILPNGIGGGSKLLSSVSELWVEQERSKIADHLSKQNKGTNTQSSYLPSPRYMEREVCKSAHTSLQPKISQNLDAKEGHTPLPKRSSSLCQVKDLMVEKSTNKNQQIAALNSNRSSQEVSNISEDTFTDRSCLEEVQDTRLLNVETDFNLTAIGSEQASEENERPVAVALVQQGTDPVEAESNSIRKDTRNLAHARWVLETRESMAPKNRAVAARAASAPVQGMVLAKNVSAGGRVSVAYRSESDNQQQIADTRRNARGSDTDVMGFPAPANVGATIRRASLSSTTEKELSSATQMAVEVLKGAMEAGDSPRAKELMKLAQLLTAAVHKANDARIHAEQAARASRRAEVDLVLVVHQVNDMARLVRHLQSELEDEEREHSHSQKW